MRSSFKSRLSHAWKKFTGQEAIYSRVFTQLSMMGSSHRESLFWITGNPVKGAEDQISLTQHTETVFSSPGALFGHATRHQTTEKPLVNPETGKAVFTRQKAAAFIRQQEQKWQEPQPVASLANFVACEQPFSSLPASTKRRLAL